MKQKRSYTVSETSLEVLNEVKQRFSLKSESAALDKLISEYVSMKAEIPVEEKIKRISLSQQQVDKNIQVILEVLNSILINDDIAYYDSETIKASVLDEAENKVRDKIARRKQVKDNGGHRIRE